MGGVPFPQRIRLSREEYEDRAAVFHVTTRAAVDRRPFVGPFGGTVWLHLLGQRTTGRVVVHTAWLMPDHLHIVAWPGRDNLVDWLGAFKSYMTQLWWRSGQRGVIWQLSFHDRFLRVGERTEAMEYVLRNPVAAGLVDKAEDWPWVAAWWDE